MQSGISLNIQIQNDSHFSTVLDGGKSIIICINISITLFTTPLFNYIFLANIASSLILAIALFAVDVIVLNFSSIAFYNRRISRYEEEFDIIFIW